MNFYLANIRGVFMGMRKEKVTSRSFIAHASARCDHGNGTTVIDFRCRAFAVWHAYPNCQRQRPFIPAARRPMLHANGPSVRECKC